MKSETLRSLRLCGEYSFCVLCLSVFFARNLAFGSPYFISSVETTRESAWNFL